MDDKAKMTALVEKSLLAYVGKSCKLAENIAGDLIADGVTLQELNGCEYCNDGKTIETDIDGEIEIVKIIPLPAIDLVTGEQERKAASPYWAMRLLLDGGEDFVRIHFCPLCGRRLPQPPKGE